MKLLILGLNYAPEPVGIGPYTTGLAEALAQRGHVVEVIIPCGALMMASPRGARTRWKMAFR